MMNEKKAPLIWLIAGEASGDLYGAQLANNIRKENPSAILAGMGGMKMKEAGVDLLVDSTELGVIGFVEVLGMIFQFVRIMKFLVTEAARQRPDVVILIDYPGFNIRLAKRLKKMGIKILWYISPQVWLWRKSNIPKLAHYCRKLICIFPFEVDVYKNSGLDVEFVGHPLLDVVEKRHDPAIIRDKNLFLLLPGSRRSETSRLLTPMLETAEILYKKHPELQFVISTPREKIRTDINHDLLLYKETHPDFNLPLTVECGKTAYYLQKCCAGLAASGTVTVECAMADLPLVVTYKLNPVTFFIARHFIIRKLFRNSFTMPNIIMNKMVFEEFLQFQVTKEALAEAVEKILPGGIRREQVEKDMEEMRKALSAGKNSAGMNAAKIALKIAYEK